MADATTAMTAAFHVPVFSWVDYAIIIIISFSVLISLIRGFVRETLSLLTWIAAFLIAFNFGNTLGDLFKDNIASQSARLAIGGGILFISTLIVGAIVNYLVSSLVEKTGLTGTDRVLGLILGGARGVLIVAVLILLANYSSISKDDSWTKSVLVPHFQPCAQWIEEFIPEAFNFVKGD